MLAGTDLFRVQAVSFACLAVYLQASDVYSCTVLYLQRVDGDESVLQPSEFIPEL